MQSTASMDLKSPWQHLQGANSDNPMPTQFQRRSDVSGSSVSSEYHIEQYLEPQAIYDGNSIDLLNGIHEVSLSDHTNGLVSNRHPSRSSSQLTEELFSDLDQVRAPARRRRGRRRASECGTPEGWVASKNLMSERKRREKLKLGLLTLRALVPTITKMDRVSILTDTITHLQKLKLDIESLEKTLESNDEDQQSNLQAADAIKSSLIELGISEGDNKNNSSTDESCSVRFYEIQLDVSRLEHGMYKLDLLCTQQPGAFVQLTQAFEAFVIQIVHTNMIAITSTKVICSFIVKMSSWNDMEMEEVKDDTKRLLRQFGLQFS